MSEGLVVHHFGDQLGQDGKEGRVFETRVKKRFRATVLNHPVDVKRGTRLAVKTFRSSKSSNRILREANFQQCAAAIGVAPFVVGVHTQEKYIAMQRCDARLVDVYEQVPDVFQYIICAYMARLDAQKILHNDGNCLNVMLIDDTPVLIDYGFSKKLKRGRTNMRITLWAMVRSFEHRGMRVPIMKACVEASDVSEYVSTGESYL